jgi:hypothetical protein
LRPSTSFAILFSDHTEPGARPLLRERLHNEVMQLSRRRVPSHGVGEWWRLGLEYPRLDGRAADDQGVRQP